MRNAIKIFFLLIIVAFKLPEQNNDYGIYKNWEDYKDHKLFCAVNPDSSKGNIKLHDVFSGKYIEIIKDGKKNSFCKDSIFGYRDKQKKDYRFYKKYDEEYQILESKEVTIYVSNILSTYSSGKNNKLVPAYFFSKKINSEILPLTVLNLKRAFPDNLKFHDMIDMEFGAGEALSTYSEKDNMYIVNRLLSKSTHQ